MGCADPAPTLIRRIEPSLKHVNRPLPSGVAILEVGVNLDGHVIYTCVLRGVRDDFDRAAQAALMQTRWKIPARKGNEKGFAVTMTVCTPDQHCGQTNAERKKTDYGER